LKNPSFCFKNLQSRNRKESIRAENLPLSQKLKNKIVLQVLQEIVVVYLPLDQGRQRGTAGRQTSGGRRAAGRRKQEGGGGPKDMLFFSDENGPKDM
jgi:hypothetical protein